MKQLIDELNSVPGVVGACVYSSRDGLKYSNLPGIFKAERLAAAGRHLTKLYSAGRMSFADLTDVSLHYDESVVVTRELQKGLLAFVVCDSSFNHNLLAMSFKLLQEELQEVDFVAVDPEGAADPPPLADPGESQEQLLALCGRLKELLGKVLGPMAGLIFDETFEVWEQKGRVAFKRLEELIEMLNGEISDPDKIQHYRQLITPELTGYQKG